MKKKEASEIFVAKPPSNKEPPEIDDTPAEEEEPVKKPRAKRPRSKAQIEHLNRVRGKAVEAAKQKKRDRLEIEKRVKEEDLPFFSDLMTGLNHRNFKCPVPIINNHKETISDYNGKKLMIVSFLEGKAKQILTPDDCKQVGVEVAKMHEITKEFTVQRNR